MVAFDGVIKADVSKYVQLVPEEKGIILPWFLSIGTSEFGHTSGVDEYGNRYFDYGYALAEIFESTEMHIIISWSTQTAALYVGEARAMTVIENDFPEIRWGK